ncbi:MAG: DUF6526 family protein [Candidatus Acidiferrales bacterium]|jgi:hypothetical protein
MTEQNFSNHARFVPAYHFFALPVFLINLGWAVYSLIVSRFSLGSIVALLLAAAFLVLLLYARMFALTAQDRIIRLEERLRYERLLPADLKPRIGEFTLDQLISLRFASDAELPELARAVLNEKLTDRKAIKQRVNKWKADYLRV